MSLRSIRFRIDAFPQILLAAALTAAAAPRRPSPSTTGSRAQTPAPAAPALTKRSFDDTPLPPAAPPPRPPSRPQNPRRRPEPARCRHPGAGRRARPSPRLPPEPAPCRRVPPRRLPAPAPTAVPAATAAPAPPIRSSSCRRRKTPRPAWTSCAKGATANGLTLADWDKYTAGAKLLPTTVSSAGQPEGRESWWDYIAKTVDDERVAGR